MAVGSKEQGDEQICYVAKTLCFLWGCGGGGGCLYGGGWQWLILLLFLSV